MPQHTIHSGLLRLYYAFDKPGAPWNWDTWKSITSVNYGLFPRDDSRLPKGWTREIANAIHTYFEAYRALPSESDRLEFASTKAADNFAGRDHWRTWVRDMWPIWRIQLRIQQAFQECNIMPIQVMIANDLTELPETTHVSDAFDRIAYALFGEDGLDGNARIKILLRDSVNIIATRASQNIRSQATRLITRLRDKEAKIEAIFDGLATNPPTTALVSELVKLVGLWRKEIMIWDSQDNLLRLAYVEVELSEIRKALGGFIAEDAVTLANSVTPTSRQSRVKLEHFKTLAAKEDVANLLSLLETHFAPDGELPEVIGSPPIPFPQLPVDGADLGTEYEAGMSYAQLCSSLGLDQCGRPFLFAKVRHVEGLTAWTKEGAALHARHAKGKTPAAMFKDIRMHWHQLSGAHAIIRKLFSAQKEPSNVPGMLIADEVGLGKSFLSILLIAFFVELGMRKATKVTLPPIIVSRPYLRSSRKIPDMPSLIVVPGTLLRQWVGELQTAFTHLAVDIFVYPSARAHRAKFWDEEYAKSAQNTRNRIIVAPQSALFHEYGLLWEPTTKVPLHVRLPFEPAPQRLGFENRKHNTLFGRQYLVVVVDEAQGARNYGSKHSAALLLLELAIIRLILTATPVPTRPEDLAAMGRMVGIRFFFTHEHHDEVMDDAAQIRKCRQDTADNSLREILIVASLRMQEQFDGRFIRRTADSLDNEGDPLLTLPPCHVVDIILKLSERELQFVDDGIPDEAIDRLSHATALGSVTESFYCMERMAVTYPREDTSEPVPTFATKAEWKAARSTKIDAVARLVRHLLRSDDAPPPVVVDGKLTLPPLPPATVVQRTRKILIYQEYSFFTPLLVNVLRLFGAEALAINGSMSYDQRSKIVERFKTGTTHRVLIFTKVGTVGLNLTVADTIILLDQQWSYADENQAIGRIHRQGQQRPVWAYHILASGTVDFFMANLARGKAALSDAFFTTDKQKQLAQLLGGKVQIVEDEDDEVDIGDAEPPKTKKAAKKKAEKPSATVKSKAKILTAPTRAIKSAEYVASSDEDPNPTTGPHRESTQRPSTSTKTPAPITSTKSTASASKRDTAPGTAPTATSASAASLKKSKKASKKVTPPSLSPTRP